MKLFMIFSIIVCATLIGGHFRNKLIKRKQFFKDLLYFVDTCIYEIGFKQSLIQDIILMTEKNINDEFKNVLEYFLQNCFNGSYTYSNNLLTKEENSLLKDFFMSIGTCDVKTQIEILNDYKNKFQNLFDKCKQIEQKRGTLYVKLAFLIGCGMGVLIL